MPLTIDSIIRQNSGGVAAATSSTPVAVALAGGEVTEAGNTLFVFIAGGNNQAFSPTPPAGWLFLGRGVNTNDVSLEMYGRGPNQGLAAGESSWNFTPINAPAGPVRWTVFEMEGVASGDTYDFIVDVTTTPTAITSGTTAVSTTTLTSTYDGLAVSVHASYNPSATDTWGSHTGGFTEIVEGSQVGSGSNNVTLSISGLHVDQLGTYGATATCSRTLTATNAGMVYTMVILAAGARRAADIAYHDGAEHGLVTGNTQGGSSSTRILETVTAGVSVSSAAARSGGYGWLLSSTSAACNFTQVPSLVFAALGYKIAIRRNFRFPTLPSADVEICVFTVATYGSTIVLRYINSSQKLGLKVSTGTEVVSDQAITANQWFGVDFLINTDSGPAADYHVDWRIDYNAELSDTTGSVAQTQGTGPHVNVPPNAFATPIQTMRIGWTTSTTATLHTDDFALATQTFYPLGDIRVLPLKVDPAGTPTISGTSTNFGVMTANGTVAAWNATNARNAIDDVPPDLSGTRDAAVCVAAHATDYAEFPMETLSMSANQVNVRAVKWVACLWAASATAATIRTKIYDGTSEISGAGFSEADPNADNSATPVWISKMARPTTGRIDWTQAKIDALTFRMGSNDATPDIGIDMIVFELAVVKAQTEVLFGQPGSLYVEAARDPDTGGLVGFTATVPGGEAIIDYEVNGTPFSAGPVSFDNSPYYEAITDGGTDFPTVNKISMNPT